MKVVRRCPVDACRSLLASEESPKEVETKRAAKKIAPDSFDVIRAAKRRLTYLKSEIKSLKKLEKERDQLERLISAAMRPLASVSPIKPAKTKSTL